jgi:hypothetical protein
MISQLRSFINLLVISTLMLPSGIFRFVSSSDGGQSWQEDGKTGLYRTEVILANAASRTRLENLGVTVLDE